MAKTDDKRENKRAGAPRQKGEAVLSKDLIVNETLKLIDEESYDNFSIRALSRRLGVYPTALYWHIGGGKVALLGEVVSRVMEGILPQERNIRWQTWLSRLFENYRQAVLEHPGVAPLIGAHITSSIEIADFIEAVLSVLENAGFSGQKLIDAYNVIVSGMVGFMTLEFASVPDKEEFADWASVYKEQLLDLSSEKYPTLKKHLAKMYNKAFILRWSSGIEAPLENSFKLHVKVLIAGLEAQLG